jgi:hypothetical protein
MNIKNIIFTIALACLSLFQQQTLMAAQKPDHSIKIKSFSKKVPDALDENSGLIYWRGLLWSHNDSGGKAEIYGFNPKKGHIEITIEIENSLNTDWEDIAQDERYIYIAETGNNRGTRTDLQVLRFEKQIISFDAKQKINVEKICFKYADQSDFTDRNLNNEHDCEAIIAHNDTIYLFSKDWVNQTTKVYALPNTPANHVIEAVDSFDVDGLVTGADLSDDGKLALVGYKDFEPFICLFQPNAHGWFLKPERYSLPKLMFAQTEGICFAAQNQLLFSCEMTPQFKQQIWKAK